MFAQFPSPDEGLVFSSLRRVTFLPKGVIVGLRNFAWGFNSQLKLLGGQHFWGVNISGGPNYLGVKFVWGTTFLVVHILGRSTIFLGCQHFWVSTVFVWQIFFGLNIFGGSTF
jgi:hypothetical protein